MRVQCCNEHKLAGIGHAASGFPHSHFIDGVDSALTVPDFREADKTRSRLGLELNVGVPAEVMFMWPIMPIKRTENE